EHDQRAWFLRLEGEQDNLRAALRWLLDQDGPKGSEAAAERAGGLRLAAALGWVWVARGDHGEGAAVGGGGGGPVAGGGGGGGRGGGGEGRARAVRPRAVRAGGGLLLSRRGGTAGARAVREEALARPEGRRAPTAMSWARTYLGLAAVVGGQMEEGTRLLRE